MNSDPKCMQHYPRERSWLRWLRAKLAAVLVFIGFGTFTLGLTGCRTIGLQDPIALTPSYHPKNFYLAQATLPPGLKRVAVLPLTCDSQRTDLTDGRSALDPILVAQLINTKRFEVVRVSPDELEGETGRAYWSGTETLPADFFSKLRKAYDCDAVMFCQLTEYRPYPPLAVGWRLKLVDARSHEILWAGDEQFDAGKPDVIAGAVRYEQENQNEFDGDATGWRILNSPRDFGRYAIAELLSTLPAR